MEEAPELFAYDSGNHCFVKRQPTCSQELKQAISAILFSESDCIRYRGDDGSVLRTLAELGLRKQCDRNPPADAAPLWRNYVTFEATFDSAANMSESLRRHLATHCYAPVKFKDINGSKNAASFEFAWFEHYFHPVQIARENPGDSTWLIQLPSHVPVGLLAVIRQVDEWLTCNATEFHEIRWYTEADWRGSKLSLFTRSPW